MSVIQSPWPNVAFPQKNVLSYLFSDAAYINDTPLWNDAADPSRNLSTRQALQLIKQLGSGLQKLGLQRGDVVLICTPNHIYVPVAYLGTVGSTFIFSGANPAYTAKEFAHQLDNTGAKVVLSHPAKLDIVLEAAESLRFPRNRIFQFSDTKQADRHGVKDWSALLASPDSVSSWTWPELTAQEARTTVATVNYSSGTTGLPKGVRISHANLIANVEQSTVVHFEGVDTSKPDNWVGFLPLYHAFGQLWTILMASRLRAPNYILSAFSFEGFFSAVQRYRPRFLQVVPPIIVMLAKRPDAKNYDISSVEWILCGAAPLKQELQNEVSQRFNLQIKQGWGMTEVTCGGISTPNSVQDRTGSVGKLLPGTEAKLLDEKGGFAEVGEPGELFVRGPQVCLGYWRNEEASRETLSSDGWLKTGDVAVHDPKSDLFWIVDRKKELIKVNGLQVAPAELEALLLENDDVADAAVVGITVHDNETPRAYVTLQASSKGKVTPRDIQDWVAARVSKHKRLTGGVSFVDEVPKLPSGKIVRKLMREWAKRDAEILEKQGEKAKF